MNYDKTIKIIDELKKLNNTKAKKLSKLVQKHMDEKDPVIQKELERKIKHIIYWTFIDLIDSESRVKIYDLGVDILDDCIGIERDANNGWIINPRGASRYTMVNDEVIVSNFIPRTYKNGFNLTNDSGLEGVNFFNRYFNILISVSKKMDEREEAITYSKKPRNKNTSMEFLEELIDYLELPRVQNIEENNKTYKKEL